MTSTNRKKPAPGRRPREAGAHRDRLAEAFGGDWQDAGARDVAALPPTGGDGDSSASGLALPFPPGHGVAPTSPAEDERSESGHVPDQLEWVSSEKLRRWLLAQARSVYLLREQVQKLQSRVDSNSKKLCQPGSGVGANAPATDASRKTAQHHRGLMTTRRKLDHEWAARVYATVEDELGLTQEEQRDLLTWAYKDDHEWGKGVTWASLLDAGPMGWAKHCLTIQRVGGPQVAWQAEEDRRAEEDRLKGQEALALMRRYREEAGA